MRFLLLIVALCCVAADAWFFLDSFSSGAKRSEPATRKNANADMALGQNDDNAFDTHDSDKEKDRSSWWTDNNIHLDDKASKSDEMLAGSSTQTDHDFLAPGGQSEEGDSHSRWAADRFPREDHADRPKAGRNSAWNSETRNLNRRGSRWGSNPSSQWSSSWNKNKDFGSRVEHDKTADSNDGESDSASLGNLDGTGGGSYWNKAFASNWDFGDTGYDFDEEFDSDWYRIHDDTDYVSKGYASPWNGDDKDSDAQEGKTGPWNSENEADMESLLHSGKMEHTTQAHRHSGSDSSQSQMSGGYSGDDTADGAGDVDSQPDGWRARPFPKEKAERILQHVNDTYHLVLSLPETGPDRDQRVIELARWFVSKARTIVSKNGRGFRKRKPSGDVGEHEHSSHHAPERDHAGPYQDDGDRGQPTDNPGHQQTDNVEKEVATETNASPGNEIVSAVSRLGTCASAVGIAVDKDEVDIDGIISTVIASNKKERKKLVRKLYSCLFNESVSSQGRKIKYRQMLRKLIALVEKAMPGNDISGNALAGNWMRGSMVSLVKGSLNVGEEQDQSLTNTDTTERRERRKGMEKGKARRQKGRRRGNPLSRSTSAPGPHLPASIDAENERPDEGQGKRTPATHRPTSQRSATAKSPGTDLNAIFGAANSKGSFFYQLSGVLDAMKKSFNGIGSQLNG